jgi:hypothetical protein
METKNQKQVYKKLLLLKDKIETFKEKDTVTLTAEEVETMKEVYDEVQVFSKGMLATRLNVGCDSCIRDAFQVFVSVFDKMHKNPNINSEATAEDAESLNVDTTDYSDQLNKSTGLKGAANQVDLEKQAQEINSVFALRTEALKAIGYEFNPESKQFVKEGRPDIDGAMIKQTTDDDFNDGLEALKMVQDDEPEEDKKPLATAVPDNGNVNVPPPVFAPEKEPKNDLTPGLALNTEASKTPAQKKGEEKAAKESKAKAKPALKGEANEAKK